MGCRSERTHGAVRGCGCMRPPAANLLAAALVALWIAPGNAEEQNPDAAEAKTEVVDICETLERAARENGLPVPFFTRLIWQESRFKATAVSPKGARGIAQFMLEHRRSARSDRSVRTNHIAREIRRVLARTECAVSATSGLAAAAYNAGERRVSDWLAGRGGCRARPATTCGSSPGIRSDAWAADNPPAAAGSAAPPGIRCAAIAGRFIAVAAPAQRQKRKVRGDRGAFKWPVIGLRPRRKRCTRLQQKFPDAMVQRDPMLVTERGRGMASRTAARVPMQTRDEANALCAKAAECGRKLRGGEEPCRDGEPLVTPPGKQIQLHRPRPRPRVPARLSSRVAKPIPVAWINAVATIKPAM